MVRRLKETGLLGIVLIVATCLAFFCTDTTFAQCPPDFFPCTGFPEWCCYNEEHCIDPTFPECVTIGGTTTVNPNCGSDEWDCGDGSCCPLWGFCCKGTCCDRETEICDNGQCRDVCVLYQTYGEDSAEVERLRKYRDGVLSRTPAGRELIRLYYQWSPTIVRAMEADEEFKEEVKEMIDGVLLLIGGERE